MFKRALTMLTTGMLLSGCGEEPQIVTYETDKPASTEVAAPERPLAQPTVIEGLLITPGEGWRAGQGNQFVAAEFWTASGLRVTVSQAGGDLTGNINRWRGQLGLPPVDRVDPAELETIDSVAGQVWVVDLRVSDKPDARRQRIGILPAMADGVPTGGLWFFKLDAPADALEQSREAFDGVLKALRWADESEGVGNDG